MSTYSWRGHPCTELELEAMTKLHPLETSKPCACGHPYEAHISMMHVMIPCIMARCPCKAFTVDAARH